MTQLTKPQRAALERCLNAPAKVHWTTAACLVPGGLLAVFDGKSGLFRTTDSGRTAIAAAAAPAIFVDSEHRDNPLCPHCGDEADGDELFEDEEGAIDGDERTTRCHACKQEYVATHHVTVTYSTRKLRAMEQAVEREGAGS